MSIATTTDPVKTIRLILDNVAAADWPNSTPPDRIERKETSRPTEAFRDSRRSDVSIYVWSPEVGTFDTFSADADRLDQREVVNAGVFTADVDTTNDYVGTVVKEIFDFADDNQTSTQWYDIEPTQNEDFSAADFQTASGFAINQVQAVLRRNAVP